MKARANLVIAVLLLALIAAFSKGAIGPSPPAVPSARLTGPLTITFTDGWTCLRSFNYRFQLDVDPTGRGAYTATFDCHGRVDSESHTLSPVNCAALVHSLVSSGVWSLPSRQDMGWLGSVKSQVCVRSATNEHSFEYSRQVVYGDEANPDWFSATHVKFDEAVKSSLIERVEHRMDLMSGPAGDLDGLISGH